MALIQRYLQDDSWRCCSVTPKLVSVSQHLRQPVNLYYPLFVTVPRVTIVTRVRFVMLANKECFFSPLHVDLQERSTLIIGESLIH